jgi:hypothetical protein
MWATAGVLVVVAIVFGVLGFQAQSKASDERDQAAAAMRHRHALVAQEKALEHDRQKLEDDVLALPDKYDDVANSYRALGDAHDHYTDVSNRAVDIHNAGDVAGAVALLQGEGTEAINDMNAKRTAAQQALQSAEDAVDDIQEGL